LIVRGPSKGNSDWLVVTQVQVQQLWLVDCKRSE